MAKLSAGKRTELVRLRKDETNCRITVALMSDGKILRKMQTDYPYPGMQASPLSSWHDSGWKVKGKAKPGITPEQFAEVYANAGYSQVSK